MHIYTSLFMRFLYNMIQSAHTSTQNLKMTSIHRSKKFCNSFQTLTTLHTPHKNLRRDGVQLKVGKRVSWVTLTMATIITTNRSHDWLNTQQKWVSFRWHFVVFLLFPSSLSLKYNSWMKKNYIIEKKWKKKREKNWFHSEIANKIEQFKQKLTKKNLSFLRKFIDDFSVSSLLTQLILIGQWSNWH